MRVHGTLKKWNDDRGYGFIALPQSHEEIFVHISAFQRSDTRPCVGEIISFEVRAEPGGRKRAVKVERPGAAPPARERGRRRGKPASKLAAAAISVICVGGYLAVAWRSSVPNDIGAPQLAMPRAEPTAGQRFQCDGRTRCSQMTSCAEAVYFLQHCPNTEMDGNNDGEPCEQQWCN